MLRRLILTLSLALVFVLAQQGVAVHEISHYADFNPASQQQDKAPHSGTCGQCLSFSGLAHALGVSYFSVAVLAAGFETTLFSSNNHRSPALTSYSARAPPHLA